MWDLSFIYYLSCGSYRQDRQRSGSFSSYVTRFSGGANNGRCDRREMIDARKMAEQADKTEGYGFEETVCLVFVVRIYVHLTEREADRHLKSLL